MKKKIECNHFSDRKRWATNMGCSKLHLLYRKTNSQANKLPHFYARFPKSTAQSLETTESEVNIPYDKNTNNNGAKNQKHTFLT